jgi:hypothetical protein
MLNPAAHDVDNSRASNAEPVQTGNSVSAQNDRRVMSAWCAWLGALATDAEAALAAALAYKQLEGPARESWLSAVEHDADRLDVPRVALFAPLLAVESDPERRARISRAMGPADDAVTPRLGASGLFGSRPDGVRIATVTTPLYLDFVQVLACAYRPGSGFEWVRHDPIVGRTAAPNAGAVLDGVTLEVVPLKHLVDELAHAVVAHVRAKRPLPDGLSCFADLFDALGLDGSLLHRRG